MAQRKTYWCLNNVYQQIYSLPDDVGKAGIAAKVEDGILTITLPKVKKEEEKQDGRKIEIG